MSLNAKLRLFLMIILPIGGATFAMFFGAGNIVFSLVAGSQSGTQLLSGLCGFLISSVGIPFLGLYAILIYRGDYHHFFSFLGHRMGQFVAGLTVLLIGVFIANPRSADLVYQTVLPYAPVLEGKRPLFTAGFFLLIFLASIRESRVIDILGFILSPVKILLLLSIVIAGLYFTGTQLPNGNSAGGTFHQTLRLGYNTMDLLAAFFFCSFIYSNIQRKLAQHGIDDPKEDRRLSLYACLIGGGLLAVIYAGFFYSANFHAALLQHINPGAMLEVLSMHLLGHSGGLFVCLIMSFACYTTSLALTSVATEYVSHRLSKGRLSYLPSLSLVCLIAYAMSTLGFVKIIHIASAIFGVLYPTLFVYTLTILFENRYSWFRWLKTPTYLTAISALVYQVWFNIS